MAIDIFGPGAQAPPAGGVELAGIRRWVRSVLVVPTLFLVVVIVSALAGVKDWLVVLTVMSALTIVSEALLVRTGVTSLALSPACVVRRGRRRTATVRAEEVSDIFIRHLTYGPIMVVSSGDTKIGLSLPAVYRNPPARDALASFLWRAGADPSLGEMGIPRPASRQRSRPASHPGQSTRLEQAHPRGAMPESVANRSHGAHIYGRLLPGSRRPAPGAVGPGKGPGPRLGYFCRTIPHGGDRCPPLPSLEPDLWPGSMATGPAPSHSTPSRGDVRSRDRRAGGPQHHAGGSQANEHVGVGGLRFHRPARAWPLPVEPGAAVLPPVPAARQSAGGGRWQMLLPVMGSLAMVGFAFVVHSLLYLVVIGLMVVSMVGATLGAQMAGNRDERRRWARAKARYLGLVDSAAADARRASELQLAGLNGLYPGPEELFGLVKATDGTWERRRSDPDFGWVRLGLGKVRSARPVKLGDSAPAANEPDPELASAAEQLVAASAYVTSAPVTAPLSGLGVVAVVVPGPEMLTRARGMVASWLASLAVFHAPGDLRIAGLVPEQAADSWDWLKWLPHCRPLQGGEGFGRARRSVTTEPSGFADVVGDLVRSRLEQTRTRHLIRHLVRHLIWHLDAGHVRSGQRDRVGARRAGPGRLVPRALEPGSGCADGPCGQGGRQFRSAGGEP